MSDQNKIRDFSSDKKYFMITPQLVWAVSRSPYDYTLWNVIKMIAGENGECYLCTEDLATLAMMSAGKASQCRKFLIEANLLIGEIRRDPGYPQPVWHLQIPDLWKQNVEWRQEFDDLSERIILKEEQKKSLHLMKPSPGEEPPSPDEEGISPGEEPPSPDETKKNQVVEPSETQEEPERGAAEKTPPAPAPSRDYLTDLFIGNTQDTGLDPGVADPSQDIETYMRYTNDFLEMYRKRTGLHADSNVQKPAIQEVASRPGADLDLWDKVITAWVKHGWNKRNVAGMLEYYERGEIPSTGNRGKPNGPNKRPNPQRDPNETFIDPERGPVRYDDTGDLVPVS